MKPPYDSWLIDPYLFRWASMFPDASLIVCKPVKTIDVNYAPTIEFKNGSEIRISAAPGNEKLQGGTFTIIDGGIDAEDSGQEGPGPQHCEPGEEG